MIFKRLSFLGLLIASSLGAQNISGLPRITPSTGLADSSLFLCTDSTKVLTRACKFNDIQKRLSFKAFDSLLTTKLNLTSGTVTGSPVFSGVPMFGAGAVISGTDASALYAGGFGVPTANQPLHVLRANGAPAFVLGNIGTSYAAPAPPVISSNLGTFAFGAYDGTSTLAIGPTISGINTEVWSSTAHGSKMTFTVRANTTITAAVALTLDQDKSATFAGAQTTTGLATFNGGATIASGQTFTLTGATITGLTAASVGTGTFPSGTYSFTGATALTGGAGNMTLVAGTGNSRQAAIQTTTSGGVATTAMRFNEVQQSLFTAGSATQPSLAVAGDSITGIYKFGTDTLGIATAGAASLGIRGGASPTIFGGAGNMIIQAGTGVSRTLTLQTTTSAGTVKNVIVLGADSTTTTLGSLTVGAIRINAPSGTAGSPSYSFSGNNGDGMSLAAAGDTVNISSNSAAIAKFGPSGSLRLPSLQSEGATKNALCWDGSTAQVTQNAAATCTVSGAQFKKNIAPVPLAFSTNIITRLHASQYEERQGGRKAFGIIAQQADSADFRLASRDGKGVINSTNYEEITSLLVDQVNDLRRRLEAQQKTIDSLVTVLRKKP